MMMYIIMERQKPYGYIYKIEFPNGKVYIGLTTTSLKQRKKEHKSCAKAGIKQYLYNALRSYNMIDKFELIEIDTADTLEELREKEIMYIFEYNSHYIDGYGYNMTYGGEGVNGWVPNQEQRKKLSEVGKKYYQETPGAREKNSEVLKKYYEDNPGAREKMRESTTKYFRETPGAREKQSEVMKKYYRETPGAREKNSEVMKKYYRETPGARGKQSEAIKKYYEDNLEAKLKNSEAQKKYYKEHPEAAKNRLDAMGKNKPFDVFTIDGTIIKSFTYQIDAIEYLQREHNITGTIKVCEVLNGNRKTSAGFVFKYK